MVALAERWDQGADTWRQPPAPGPRTTPRTRVTWEGVAGWCDAWLELQRRRAAALTHTQQREHLAALTADVVAAERCRVSLERAERIVRAEQPHRGARADHITTQQLNWIDRRLAALDRLDRLTATPAAPIAGGQLSLF